MMDQVSVRIPATSANLGPGFDCLGVALDCHNLVTITRDAPGEPSAMVTGAGRAFFDAARTSVFDFSWNISGNIPRSRGMGSSVAVRLGVLHGLNELSGRPLDGVALYRICAELEGHPDNAAPAAFGGFAVARADTVYFRCEVSPALHFILLIPDQEIETEASRGRLPEMIAHAEAARNAANASLITAAFASGRYDLLRGSLRDWLHEPYRENANPHLRPAVDAGISAGALGGYLSGSGSAVACLTLENPAGVAAAMQAVAPSAPVLVLRADNSGTVVSA